MRPSQVVTVPPSSPLRAASSTRRMARGNTRRSRGTSCPPVPDVAPYIAPSTAYFASSRFVTAPEATTPS
nr:hypothetical protein [Microbacterium sp. NIBRBAC000506063]